MVDMPGHYCGVVAMALTSDAVPSLKRALRVIQHRGQEGAGIAVYKDDRIQSLANVGLVHEVLSGPHYNEIEGNYGIGHVRYSTTGRSVAQNCQPIVVTSAIGDVAVGHNGDLVNSEAMREKLQNIGWAFLTTTDSEIIIRLLVNELKEGVDPIKAIRNVMRSLDGAYSLVIMIKNRIFGVRDPLGFHPLSIGKLDKGYGLASESAVFDILQGQFVRDVNPGEIVEISSDGYTVYPSSSKESSAHCMFEWIYFARPDSVLDGKEVYDVRKRLGMILAREHPVDADVVIPVPDSGRAHAIGYAAESGIPYEEGFMKNRYVERTFILPEQSMREEGVGLKLNPIKSTVAGKRIVVVDDSIVRGTTLRKIIQLLRKAGAKEVHVRIGCPPVIAPCYYGVDMRTRDQFIATNRSIDEIAEYLTADSVKYTNICDVEEAIGMPASKLCVACLNGEYPTNIPGEKCRTQHTLDSFKEGSQQ